jgi:hypothetical protein
MIKLIRERPSLLGIRYRAKETPLSRRLNKRLNHRFFMDVHR